MTKNELEKIVMEILGTSERSAFNAFINEIGTSLNGKEALKLDGIGVFQKKKEPLSRMERKSEGSIGEKELLLFKPENSAGEESILSFDIDGAEEAEEEFSDSVFDVSINKSTIISDDSEDEIAQERNGNLEKIKEFVASGEVYPDFDLLEVSQTSENMIEEKVDKFTETERTTDFTEAEINKEFMIDVPIEDDEYDETSSDIEPEITEEDVLAVEEASESLHDENSEINLSDEQDESNSNEEENPFDELENYITKDESDSDVEEIINSEPEEEEGPIIPEVTEEPLKSEKNTKVKERKSFRDIRGGGEVWYKNPILYIASASLIVAIAVVIIFWPSDKSTNEVVTENVALVDSANHSDKKMEPHNANKTEKMDDKTKVLKQDEPKVVSETKKVETKKPDVKFEQKKTVNSKKELGPLYREIKNDKSITKRIYFDGSKYMVQASSWRSTSIAEREVKKLRKRGFDAFIYKVYIKSKNGTWNRVRIGYFNSRKEAEKFLAKNKI